MALLAQATIFRLRQKPLNASENSLPKKSLKKYSPIWRETFELREILLLSLTTKTTKNSDSKTNIKTSPSNSKKKTYPQKYLGYMTQN